MQEPHTISEDYADTRLDRWFMRHYPQLTKGAVEKLLRSGQIRINKSRAKGDYRLKKNDEIRIPPQLLKDLPMKKEKSALNKADKLKWQKLLPNLILFENEDVIAINKPSGLAVQGGSKVGLHVDKLLPLLARGGETPRLVHRLDKQTSGVLLLAKNRKAAEQLTTDFKERKITKLYWALVAGKPKPEVGRIAVAISKQKDKDSKGGFEKMQADDGANMAETLYSTLQNEGGLSWVALSPLSGRTHQIRVHLAHIGKPILGDQKYGGKKAFPPKIKDIKRIYLHARAIHYQGNIITAPLFDDFSDRMIACNFNPELKNKDKVLKI